MSSTDEFAVFQTFSTVSEAMDVADFLKTNNVQVKVVDNAPPVDITFSVNTLENEVQLLIKQSDFEKSNLLIAQHAQNSIDDVDESHYLFDFSSEELKDVLAKPDEWHSFDQQLSLKILNDRGIPISHEEAQSLKNDRLNELAKPEIADSSLITIGFVMAALGGLGGMFIGWHLWKFKKTIPDGRKVFKYQTRYRNIGRNMFLIGAFFGVFLILISIIRSM